MRNALILLAVVALLILVVGALNNGTTFEVDYVAGTVSAVSMFWVSAVIAALVFVAGLAATWFALAGAAGGRRKLEAELQATFERLREAEALAARPAPPAEAAPVATVAQAPPVVVAVEEATVVAGEAAEDVTVIAGEDVTMVAGEEETVVTDDTAAVVAAEPSAEPGEATAVTMAGEALVDDAAAADAAGGESTPAGQDAGEPLSEEPRGDEPRPSGS